MHISNCTMFNWCKRFKKLHADGLVCLSWTFWRISLSFSQFFFGFILFINYLYSLGRFCSATFILYFFFLRKFNAFHFVLIKTAWYNIQRIHKYSLSFRFAGPNFKENNLSMTVKISLRFLPAVIITRKFCRRRKLYKVKCHDLLICLFVYINSLFRIFLVFLSDAFTPDFFHLRR